MSLPDHRGEDKDSEYVYIYDFDTQIVSTIPAAELAPGMVRARMDGMDAPVRVDGSRLQQNSFQHPPFPEGIRDLFRQIKAALDEVYPQSQVLAVTDRGSLSPAEAERIVNAFFEEYGTINHCDCGVHLSVI